MKKQLSQLLEKSDIWQAKHWQHDQCPAISSGLPELDQWLPGHGWPQKALTEILTDTYGIGELRLLLPALSHLSHEGRWILWVNPPYIPYPPALKTANIDINNVLVATLKNHNDALWAMEQGLKSGSCSAVLGWPKRIKSSDIRRLQLAAESGNSLTFFFDQAEMRLDHLQRPYDSS